MTSDGSGVAAGESRASEAHAGALQAGESQADELVREVMVADVRAGLSLPQKELPPTWFYDARGSRLFEEITRLPEYYLTRAERALLVEHSAGIASTICPATVAELGAGSAEKTRVLIEAVTRLRSDVVYAPIDVSAATLELAAAILESAHPGLRVIPVTADIRDPLELPSGLPRPLLYTFLGSTIGNFARSEAVTLLSRMRADMVAGDRLLLGVDLVKDVEVLERAYNDSRGVTAAFNLNVLRVLNRELGADFELTAFAHMSFYNAQLRRIEMHLVSQRRQTVRVPGAGDFEFEDGETIRTEISCKYDREEVASMLGAAGFELDQWLADDTVYALVLGSPQA